MQSYNSLLRLCATPAYRSLASPKDVRGTLSNTKGDRARSEESRDDSLDVNRVMSRAIARRISCPVISALLLSTRKSRLTGRPLQCANRRICASQCAHARFYPAMREKCPTILVHQISSTSSSLAEARARVVPLLCRVSILKKVSSMHARLRVYDKTGQRTQWTHRLSGSCQLPADRFRKTPRTRAASL